MKVVYYLILLIFPICLFSQNKADSVEFLFDTNDINKKIIAYYPEDFHKIDTCLNSKYKVYVSAIFRVNKNYCRIDSLKFDAIKILEGKEVVYFWIDNEENVNKLESTYIDSLKIKILDKTKEIEFKYPEQKIDIYLRHIMFFYVGCVGYKKD